MITSSPSKMRKSGLASYLLLEFISYQHFSKVFVWRERLQKISELSNFVITAQLLDNLYLKTLCKPTAVISALMYNCTCTIAAPPLQGFTIVQRQLFRQISSKVSISLQFNTSKFTFLLPRFKAQNLRFEIENCYPCNVYGSYYCNIV